MDGAWPQRLRAIALDRGAAIALAALVIYVWVTPPYIVGGDNAEFITAATVGGVPHPSGYPLYMLWLRMMSWLPGENAAHSAAISTAILGAATVLVLHATCRAWGARPAVASITVAVFAAAPVIIRQVTEAEVFALNMLVVTLVMWIAARAGPVRGIWRGVLLGLVAGLGMANHLTCVLIAPVGILGVIRATKERGWIVVPASIAALAVGLTPYVYLFVTPDTPISWRTISNLSELLHHIRREDYGGPGAFSPGRDPVSLADNVSAYVGMLARNWLVALPLVGLVTLGWRIARPEGETRWGWITLAASFLIAGPLLIARFNVPIVGVGLTITYRFHMMSALILAVPIAAGLDALVRRASAWRTIAIRKWIVAALPFVIFFAAASRSLPSHSAAIDRCAGNILRSLPENSVLILTEDYLYFGTMYRQLVMGERPDVTIVAWGQLINPGYRQRLHARSGITPEIPPDKQVSLVVTRDVFAKGRPLLVDPAQIRILQNYPTYPFGIVMRVVPVGTKLPTPVELFAINKDVYSKYRFDYPVPGRDDDYAAHAQDRYARALNVIGRALMQAGQRDQAAEAFSMAATLRP